MTQTDVYVGEFVPIYDYEFYEEHTDYEIVEEVDKIDHIKFDME